MTENDTNDSKNDWKGHEWVKLTKNIRKKVKRTRNNKKWPKMTNCHHGGKMTKMTENDNKRIKDMF